MTTTFLLTLNLSDTDLQLTADEISDDLAAAGHDVVEVKPWARPVTAPQTATPPSLS